MDSINLSRLEPETMLLPRSSFFKFSEHPKTAIAAAIWSGSSGVVIFKVLLFVTCASPSEVTNLSFPTSARSLAATLGWCFKNHICWGAVNSFTSGAENVPASKEVIVANPSSDDVLLPARLAVTQVFSALKTLVGPSVITNTIKDNNVTPKRENCTKRFPVSTIPVLIKPPTKIVMSVDTLARISHMSSASSQYGLVIILTRQPNAVKPTPAQMPVGVEPKYRAMNAKQAFSVSRKTLNHQYFCS
mmetsp:Transcript_15584/g.29122  ORF Transcript_15584/g.29122 Transcript_15584/m.29122 type:complete len:246 (+) Transcript_15584:655-1392(+)